MKNYSLAKIFLILLVATGLFFIYSYLLIGFDSFRYSWPDEMATDFFIEQYEFREGLQVDEPLNDIAVNLVVPRSMTLVQGNLVPTGFIGMPLLYGLFSQALPFAVNFVTPFLAVVAVFTVYKLTELLFNKRVGMIAAALFALQPAWLYYASFSLLPNIPFMTFLLLGIYFLLRNFYHKNIFYNYTLSSFFLAIALSIRPNEVIWIAPILLLILIGYRKSIRVLHYLHFLFPALIVGLLFVYTNFLTYSSYLGFGYTTTVVQEGGELTAPAAVPLWQQIVAPFGVDFQIMLDNIMTFVLPIHWYFVLLAIFGVVAVLFFEKTQIAQWYLIIVFLISAYLLVYYGSWQLVDDFVGSHSQLGISYNRYWLPIIVMLIPLIAYFLHDVMERVREKSKILSIVFIVGSLTLISLLNVYYVYAHGNDNLMAVKQSISETHVLHDRIMELTEEESVIITERGDKIVFPERKVIAQYNPSLLGGIQDLVEQRPVYYLIYKDELFIERLNEAYFVPQGLRIENPLYIDFEYILYEVNESNN